MMIGLIGMNGMIDMIGMIATAGLGLSEDFCNCLGFDCCDCGACVTQKILCTARGGASIPINSTESLRCERVLGPPVSGRGGGGGDGGGKHTRKFCRTLAGGAILTGILQV